jgi:hypothetical protein
MAPPLLAFLFPKNNVALAARAATVVPRTPTSINRSLGLRSGALQSWPPTIELLTMLPPRP